MKVDDVFFLEFLNYSFYNFVYIVKRMKTYILFYKDSKLF